MIDDGMKKCVYWELTKMADIMEKEEKTIAEDLVVSKYKLSGEIVNRTLKAVIDLCVAGGSVRDICKKSDALITEKKDFLPPVFLLTIVFVPI